MKRCAWATSPLGIAYHDREWGVPVHDDRVLFAFLILEGAQAGLSWETILRKRENYRRALAGFDPAKVARFTPAKVKAFMKDEGLVRNRRKLESAVTNARAFLAAGAERTISWQITAPASIATPVARAAVKVSVDFHAGRTPYTLTRTLDVTAVNPLTSLSGYGSVPSQFGEAGGSYAILTSGADIWQDGGGSFDEYGTIYGNDVAGTSSTVTTGMPSASSACPRLGKKHSR